MTAIIDYNLARLIAAYVDGRTPTGLDGMAPSGWVRDPSFSPQGSADGTGDPGELRLKNDLCVYALKSIDSTDDRRILAFRGAEDLRNWLLNFTDLGETQFTSAASNLNEWLAQQLVNGSRIELVGHSLGGAFVQWTVNDANRVRIDTVAQWLTNDRHYRTDPCHLHFTTYNAPGITHSPGELLDADLTTAVDGEHHVIPLDFVFPFPGLQGDLMHVLGGRPVGGKVVAHRVDLDRFATGSTIYDAHRMNHPWWNAPVDPGYDPPFAVDFQSAQLVGRFVANMLDPQGRVRNGQADALKIGLVLGAGLTAGAGLHLGMQLGQVIQEIGGDLRALTTGLLAPTPKVVQKEKKESHEGS